MNMPLEDNNPAGHSESPQPNPSPEYNPSPGYNPLAAPQPAAPQPQPGPLPEAAEPAERAAPISDRRQARAIKAYLTALQSRKPGRPVTKKSLEERLGRLTEKIESTDDPLGAVELIQKRLDLEKALAEFDERSDFDMLQADFVRCAKPYSERKGITYTAWRQVGVPASVLKAAGIPETRRR